jgi:hypothetical protein
MFRYWIYICDKYDKYITKGFEVTMQELGVYLASKMGDPPNASAIVMKHAAERHLDPYKEKSKFSFK